MRLRPSAGPADCRLDTDEVHVWRLNVACGGAARFDAILSEAEKGRAARFVFPADRERFAVAHGLLRLVLGAYLGRSPRSLELDAEQGIKPRLPADELKFNLSRSGSLALLAVSANAELGADLERVRPLKDMMDVARRFFAPSEYADLQGVAPDDQRRSFFDCWTRKEAFVKALGEGLPFGLDRFRVSLKKGEPAALLEVDGRSGEQSPWRIDDLSWGAEYAAALAVKLAHPKLRGWRLDDPEEALRLFGPGR